MLSQFTPEAMPSGMHAQVTSSREPGREKSGGPSNREAIWIGTWEENRGQVGQMSAC